MNILIACEESQRVCSAFRDRGHSAFSCDIQPCSGGHPEWHIHSDVKAVLKFSVSSDPICFYTADGVYHSIYGDWDLVIAHPPCTYLCNSNLRWYDVSKYGDKAVVRKAYQKDAIAFFLMFTKLLCPYVIENPVGIMSNLFRKPDCVYNPYEFIGETEAKRTCLWVSGVPPLKPTRLIPLTPNEITHNLFKSVYNGRSVKWGSAECSRLRSQTPFGVASAMADQWGGYGS